MVVRQPSKLYTRVRFPSLAHSDDIRFVSHCTRKQSFTAPSFMRSFSLWKRLFFSFGLFVVFAAPMDVVLTPAAEAGLVPCATSENPEPCTLCHLMQGVQNILNWGLGIMTYFAVAVIVAMGILYIVSTGNPGTIKTAKEGLKATLYGFALMLLMYLFVSVILVTLAKNVSNFKPGTTSWFDFSCDSKSNVGTSTMPIGGDTTPSGGSTTCGVCSNLAPYIQGNEFAAIIQAGEHYKQNPCTRPSNANGSGACGYSQVIPKWHHDTCGFSGTDAAFCAKLISDTRFDLDCGAAVVKAYRGNSKCQGIKNLALCYNGGPGHGSCGDKGGGICYGDRVEQYYNSCGK